VTSIKPVEEMTLEEIQAERARLAAEREAALSTESEKPAEAENKPLPWPHQTLTYEGAELEVRIPSETALLAVSMAGMGGLDAQTQLAVFTKFLSHHMSPASFAHIVGEMTDPDSPVDLQPLITALAGMRKAE
jgi:hypothetical protein